MDQEEYDLERVRVYWDINKDLAVGFLFGVLVPAILAIFLISESYFQATPPNLFMGYGVALAGLIGFLVYLFFWTLLMRRAGNGMVKLLDKVRKGEEIDSKLPDYLNPKKDVGKSVDKS